MSTKRPLEGHLKATIRHKPIRALHLHLRCFHSKVQKDGRSEDACMGSADFSPGHPLLDQTCDRTTVALNIPGRAFENGKTPHSQVLGLGASETAPVLSTVLYNLYQQQGCIPRMWCCAKTTQGPASHLYLPVYDIQMQVHLRRIQSEHQSPQQRWLHPYIKASCNMRNLPKELYHAQRYPMEHMHAFTHLIDVGLLAHSNHAPNTTDMAPIQQDSQREEVVPHVGEAVAVIPGRKCIAQALSLS
eukprot:1158803-Pelagomonas_calceolata.AAC.5